MLNKKPPLNMVGGFSTAVVGETSRATRTTLNNYIYFCLKVKKSFARSPSFQ